MKKLFLCLTLVSVGALVGCGSDDNNENTISGLGIGNNHLGGTDCGGVVVSDYEDVVDACTFINSVNSGQNILNCRNLSDSFVAKYPEINCSISADKSAAVSSDLVVTEAHIQSIRK